MTPTKYNMISNKKQGHNNNINNNNNNKINNTNNSGLKKFQLNFVDHN